jgi:uncharacterized protein YecE (DUF72 family)
MIRVGTSGWSYKHWKSVFYPEGIPQKKWLEYYADRFDTVELNASFYRIPSSRTTDGWRNRTPDGFVFSVKMSRLITHVHRLRDCEEQLRWFFEAMAPLREKTAVFLIQLPPSLEPDREGLEAFIRALPHGNRYAFEFRNRKSYSGAVVEVLAERGMGFCIHDIEGSPAPMTVTADFVYVRFHGYGGRYRGCYPDSVLKSWSERITSWASTGKDVYVYFNNDLGGNAVENAGTLIDLLKEEQ